MQLRTSLQSLAGFKRHAALFGLGGLSILSMPPVGFFPILLLTVPAFIWMTDVTESRMKSFLAGWSFGAGYMIFGFYWISAALFVDIKQWAWVMPFSLVAGPGLMGLYYGFIPLLCRKWRGTTAYALLFIAAWSLAEFARGHLLTGFPWNLVGYAWDRVLPMLQISSVIGVYGLTLLTLFWAAMPVYRQQKKIFILALASLAAVFAFGAARLTLHPTENSPHTVRIVQANIPQDRKWGNEDEWRNFEKHLALTKKEGFDATFTVWAETAVTADLVLYPEIAHHLGRSLPAGGVAIVGNLRIRQKQDGKNEYFNSAAVVDSQARVLDNYDKHHLVPFGEFIPFRKVLNVTPVGVAISGIGEFTSGAGPRSLSAGGLPRFSPLICYEVIFPGEVADKEDRPDWLVNITNDGWYGNSAGPYQHLAISRMRAVEEGLPLARAANTGISAMIDPLGRYLGKLPIRASGTVDTALPLPLPQTFYSRYGTILFFILLVSFVFAVTIPKNSFKSDK